MTSGLAACVVDASVALKWVIEEEGSAAALALLDGPALLAPELLQIESANALWRIARRGGIKPADAADAFDLLQRLPLRRPVADAALAPEALRLAQALDHPVYDCVYLALAIEAQTPVVTADRRLLRAAESDAELSGMVRALDTL